MDENKNKTGSILDSLSALTEKSTGYKRKDTSNITVHEKRKIQKRRMKNKEARKARRAQRKRKK